MFDRAVDTVRTQTETAIKAQKLGMDWAAAQQKIAEKQVQAMFSAASASFDASREATKAMAEVTLAALPKPDASA